MTSINPEPKFCLKMNSDEIGHYYVNLLYATLQNSPEEVDKLYDPSAVLTQKFCDEEEITIKEKFPESLVKGEHVVMRCDGIQIGDEITVHASGYVKLEDKYYQSNEMFVFKAKADPIILYQSSYFSPVLDPEWKPVEPPKPKEEKPKEEKKPEKPEIPEPVEVQSSNDLMYNRTVLFQNLPFKAEPFDLIKERLMRPGVIITKYCKGKAKILVEFDNPSSCVSVIEKGDFTWKGRSIKVKGMPQGYHLGEAK